jgi:hypothetical protein
MRIKGGLTKWHYLALLLDPRPKMRKIAQELVGNAADNNLGNTAFIHQANAAIDEIASVVITYKRDKSQRTKAQTAAVLKAQLLAFIEVCESVCVATSSVCVCHHAFVMVTNHVLASIRAPRCLMSAQFCLTCRHRQQYHSKLL